MFKAARTAVRFQPIRKIAVTFTSPRSRATCSVPKCIILGVALVLSFASTSIATTAWAQSRASSAMPLSKQEFDTIVAEAQTAKVVRLGASARDLTRHGWRTLTPDKLKRMLKMPEFANIDERPEKETLLDQAGSWELMPLLSPSQAVAMWTRWYPNDSKYLPTKSGAQRANSPQHFYADANWAPQAGAMIALFSCLAPPAWSVLHDDPMLWAMENGGMYEPPNAFDFGVCVRKQSESGMSSFEGSPDTARGKQSAAILERLLSGQLKKVGCAGTGPDRCLPLLHALVSLNPRQRELPDLIKRLEPEFNPSTEVMIPEVLRDRRGSDTPNRQRGNLSDAERAQVRELQRATLLKVFFLTAKLPVLLDRPNEWPAGEIDRSIGAVLKHTIMMGRSKWLMQGRTNYLVSDSQSRQFADPWRILNATTRPDEVAKSLFAHGRLHAQVAGCGLAEQQLAGPGPEFWFGYALTKLEREANSCGAMPTDWVAARYVQAARQPEKLRELEGLRAFIAKADANADTRTMVIALGKKCPQTQVAVTGDPWGICAAAQRAATTVRAHSIAGVWHGLLGTSEVVACMNPDGAASYYYRGVGRPIRLLGEQSKRWTEQLDGRVTGRWQLEPSGRDEIDRLDGRWRDAKGARHRMIHLERIVIAEGQLPCSSPEFVAPQAEALAQLQNVPGMSPADDADQVAPDGSDRKPARSADNPNSADVHVLVRNPRAQVPFMDGTLQMFTAPPENGAWEVAGRYFASGSRWLALGCERKRCALTQQVMHVAPIRKIVASTRSEPGQRISWRWAPGSASGRLIALLGQDAEFAWLKPGPVITYFDGQSKLSTPDGPGDLEVLIRSGPVGAEVLAPVIDASGGLQLELRVGKARQVLGRLASGRGQGDEQDEDAKPAQLESESYLLWAGDLDGDGKTDLLVVLDSGRMRAELFLSSNAEPSMLVGQAAAFELIPQGRPR